MCNTILQQKLTENCFVVLYIQKKMYKKNISCVNSLTIVKIFAEKTQWIGRVDKNLQEQWRG
jgi:hypothetical protein